MTIALGLTMIPGSAGADPGPATHVDSVSATVGSTAIQVGGTATFTDVPATVGEDPTGDAVAPVPGTDLTTLTIARPNPAASSLLFRMGIADQPPAPLSGPPFAVYYMWELSVAKPDGTVGATKVLQANRLLGTALPSTNPTIRVLTYNASGECGCSQVAVVSGKMADGVIEWPVSFANIGASSGDTIAQQGIIGPIPGAGAPVAGNRWFPGAPFDSASMDAEYVVPGASVQLGIAPAGTPEDQVELTATAAVSATTGIFSGSLEKPAGTGDHIVVAQACFGPGNCGLASATVRL